MDILFLSNGLKRWGSNNIQQQRHKKLCLCVSNCYKYSWTKMKSDGTGKSIRFGVNGIKPFKSIIIHKDRIGNSGCMLTIFYFYGFKSNITDAI
jgi:hypothetical protein